MNEIDATSFLGGPQWVSYIAFVVVLFVTGIAGLRYRHFREIGDNRKANQLRINIGFGVLLSALVGIRAFVLHG